MNTKCNIYTTASVDHTFLYIMIQKNSTWSFQTSLYVSAKSMLQGVNTFLIVGPANLETCQIMELKSYCFFLFFSLLGFFPFHFSMFFYIIMSWTVFFSQFLHIIEPRSNGNKWHERPRFCIPFRLISVTGSVITGCNCILIFLPF